LLDINKEPTPNPSKEGIAFKDFSILAPLLGGVRGIAIKLRILGHKNRLNQV
jgi:hypothetical protein